MIFTIKTGPVIPSLHSGQALSAAKDPPIERDPERSEGSALPAQDDTTVPILVVKNHYWYIEHNLLCHC